MAGIENILAGMGYTPAGTRPNFVDGTKYDLINQAFAKIVADEKQRAEDEMKKKEKQASMYRTLRTAGYGPQSAWKAIQEGQKLPEPGPDDNGLAQIKPVDKIRAKQGQANLFGTLKRAGYPVQKAWEISQSDEGIPAPDPADFTEKEDVLKKKRDQAGVYKDLITAGYSPDEAWKATQEGGDIPAPRAKTSEELLSSDKQRAEDRRRKKDQAVLFYRLKRAGYTSNEAWRAIQEGVEIPEPMPEMDEKELKPEKGLTADQKDKRRIGRNQVIKTIELWGKRGTVLGSEGIEEDIPDADTLQMYLMNNKEMSDSFDLEDPGIQRALAIAVKRKHKIDLPAQAKKEGKPLGQTLQEFFSATKEKAGNFINKMKGLAASEEPAFDTEEQVYEAVKAGKIQKGQKFRLNGKLAIWE